MLWNMKAFKLYYARNWQLARKSSAAKTDDHDLVLTNPVVIKFNFKLKKIRK